jgi:hypothetical protein
MADQSYNEIAFLEHGIDSRVTVMPKTKVRTATKYSIRNGKVSRARWANVAARFWASTIPVGDCVEWNGRRVNGYGTLMIHGQRKRAHRVAYEWVFGAIPSGLFVCHSCDNPPCVNPAHLFLGTAGDNSRDAARKGRLRTGPLSPETRAKVSASHMGMRVSPEARAKISAAKRGKPGPRPSAETRAKMSVTRREWWQKRKAEKPWQP